LNQGYQLFSQEMKQRTTIYFRWLKIIVIVYCSLGIAFYYLQKKILFRPVTIATGTEFTFKQPFKEVNLKIDELTTYNLVQFTVPDSIKKGVVLYFHGNRTNITRYARFSNNFTKHGYEVWMPDYPTYGKSTGEISEENLYEESLQLYKLARVQFPPEKIIIYGKSMGTGIAAQLASIRDCKQLILETPYNSMVSLLQYYAPIYPMNSISQFKIPTDQCLTKVTATICIFHGTNDGVIPFSNAKKLKAVLKKSDEFITIDGGNHFNLNEFPIMQKKLDSLLSIH
jgi:uncharacterized protein